MKKTLTLFAGACFLAGSCLIVGCGEEASVKKEETVTAPGGTATTSQETKVKTTGDNPPPAPDAK